MPGLFQYFGSFASAPPASLLLDLYPTNGTGAYFLHKVKSDAVNCINVRRASDDAVIEVGFVGVDLDTAAIAAHCAGTQGYVSYWHDQSGNGLDLTQATAAAQPLIYDGGVVTLNSKPAMDFNGSKYLYASVNGVGTTTNSAVGGNLFVSGIGKFDSDYQFMTLISKNRSGVGLNKYSILRNGNSALVGPFLNLNSSNEISVPDLLDLSTLMHSFNVSYDGLNDISSIDYFKNNLLIGGDTDTGELEENDQTFMLGALVIGTSPQGTAAWPLSLIPGKIQCFGLWGLDQTTNRSAINTIINDYYGVY